MTMILKQLFSFFRLLNSETGLYQLSLGLALGVVIGFSPILSLQCLIIILCCILFRIQLGAAFLSAFFFKFIAYTIDDIANLVGREILENATLRPFFITMYNIPLVPLTRFNNSIVMGSGVIGVALSIPFFFIFRLLIMKYRKSVVEKYKKSKIWKAWVGTSFYKWYSKYQELYG